MIGIVIPGDCVFGVFAIGRGGLSSLALVVLEFWLGIDVIYVFVLRLLVEWSASAYRFCFILATRSETRFLRLWFSW